MLPPPRGFLPVLEKIKSCYIIWNKYHQILPKHHRYSLGNRIDNLFVEAIETISIAGFLSKEEKAPYIRVAIRKIDTVKVLFMILWETKSLEEKKYIGISLLLNRIGQDLGGWYGQVTKTSPNFALQNWGKK